MTLDQIVTFVKANIANLPLWFTSIFWHVVAAILLVSLLIILFTAVSNSKFKDPMLAILSFTKNLLRSFLAGSFKAIESPIDRPKTKLAIKALAIFHSYLMCLFFFAMFLAFVFAAIVVALPVSFWLKLGQMGLILFMLYLAAFFRAEADRDWLAFKKQLEVVRNHNK
jgi:hypothetical protein